MTAFTWFLVVLTEISSLGGQLLFKRAMGEQWENARAKAWCTLAGGAALMTVGFFVWLSLLARFELSFLYPFDGLSRLALLGAAAVILHERISFRLLTGALLIAVGVAFVATS